MKKTLLKMFISSVWLLSFLPFTNSSGQVLHTESFDGNLFLPAGWSAVGPINWWARATQGFPPTFNPHSGPGMARYNSQTAPVGDIQTIATPVIDLQGVTINDTARFSFWINRNDSLPTYNDSLSIFVNTSLTTTGATWIGSVARSRVISQPDTQAANGWYQYSFDIPQSFNTGTNYILLSGNSQQGLRIYIDDCEWTSWIANCSGTPTAGTVAISDTILCGPGNVDLSLTGGSTGSAGLSYQWMSSPSLAGPWTNFGTDTTVINAVPVSATTYFQCVVTCTISGLTDTSAIVYVTVNPNPPPTITVTPDQSTYCNFGPPVMIIATGANTYAWTAPPGVLNTNIGDTVYAAPPQMGGPPQVYTVTGTDLFGCTATASFQVTFHNTPTVIIDPHGDSGCPGDSVTLNADQTGIILGGVTWVWQPGGETTQSITVAPASATSYTVTGTSAFGCSLDTSIASTTVNVGAAMVPSFTYSITGNTVTFTNTSQGGTYYIWDFGDGNASFNQNPVYTYIGNNTYTVTLTVFNGVCTPVTYTQVIVVGFAGIQQIDNNKVISVYPNPVKQNATIEFSLNIPDAKFSIVNPIGQSILEKEIYPKSGYKFKEEIDMSNFDKGIYFVHVKTSLGNFIQKISKQ